MSPEQGRLVYDHVRATRPDAVLELGTAHGVGAAYLAAALEANAHGRLTTVDFAGAAYDPPPETVLARAGAGGARDGRARVLLLHLVAQGAGAGALGPRGQRRAGSDFVYLDGAKNWTIDGLAVVLIEKLLRPGGWLLMDDLPWTYAQDPGREATYGIVHRELSEPERSEPHLRAVFALIVAQHPSFTELKIQDEWWGWARKAPGEPRTLSLETSRLLGALLAGAPQRLVRRAQPRLAADQQAVAEVELVALEQVGVALGPGAGCAGRPRAAPARAASSSGVRLAITEMPARTSGSR